jgi:ADP-ribosylglycohydrolase
MPWPNTFERQQFIRRSLTRKLKNMHTRLEDKIYGCLLGGLIGDAMGAPGEGKTYQQIQERFGPAGITDFEGVGTDDTAIREQLIDAILSNGGYVSCDEFAASFHKFRLEHYSKWWVPVRNMFHKLDSSVALPVDAGWGNAPSSSSAMAISPMGILNAANPRQAAVETFDVAGLIHSGLSGFCRDAACAMAAAVAQAFHPEASAATIGLAATQYLHPVSAHEIIGCIQQTRQLAVQTGDYEAFRAAFYKSHLWAEQCDSRETVPVALALFEMAAGEPERAILWGVNFGRDADTIGTMVGGLCGAYRGASGLPPHWVSKVEDNPDVQYRNIVPALVTLVRSRADRASQYARTIAALDQASAREDDTDRHMPS